MRTDAGISSVWSSGIYIGNNKASGRVTVNPTWHLALDHASSAHFYEWWRVPFRRWAETGSDIEVPYQVIKSIQINRGITEDCAQLTLTIKNSDPAGGPNKAGQGYFSLRKGGSGWGDLTYPGTSASYGHFSPGSMVKTYQGYGEHLVPTGVWIIDDCNVNARGELVAVARDLGSLLVDQVMYPPFMPDGCYPTQFYSATWNEEVNGDPVGFFPTVTNYEDIVCICELIACWAGFHAPDGTGVLGHVEHAGIDMPAPIKHDFFDKKHPIDVIKELLKIVGFRVWVDQEGGLRMTSQNVWEAGNRTADGSHTSGMIEISDLQTLTDLTASWSRRADRSHIIVSQGNPEIEKGVKHALLDSSEHQFKNMQRGAVSPAFFMMEQDLPLTDMIQMAELTYLRTWWARHGTGTVARANPLIDPDDQVLITEASTGEAYSHRVKSISTMHDFDTGDYVMNLETNWMGSIASGWFVEYTEDGHVRYNGPGDD